MSTSALSLDILSLGSIKSLSEARITVSFFPNLTAKETRTGNNLNPKTTMQRSHHRNLYSILFLLSRIPPRISPQHHHHPLPYNTIQYDHGAIKAGSGQGRSRRVEQTPWRRIGVQASSVRNKLSHAKQRNQARTKERSSKSNHDSHNCLL